MHRDKHVYGEGTLLQVSWSLVTSILNWSIQVSKACKNARQQVGILHWKFYPSANTLSLLQPYLAYIHPPLPTGTYQLPIESAEVCTEGVHQTKSSGYESSYASVLQPAHPCQQKTAPSNKTNLLHQIGNGHLNFPTAPTVP